MTLKFSVDSLDGMDEHIAPLYEEQNGKYYLAVDGAVSKGKLDEFRDNNIELTNQLKQFEGVDLNEIKTMKTELDTLRTKKSGMTQDEVDNMLNDRVKSMKRSYEEKIKGLDTSNQTLNSQLEVLVIDNTVRTAATKHKVLDTAVDDVVLRAKSAFRMKDGVAKSYDGQGNVIFGKDGESPLTVGEWVKDLSKSAPHLFTQSTGGGARNNSGGNGRAGSAGSMSPLGKISEGLASRN